MNLDVVLQQHSIDILSLILPEYQPGGAEHLIYLLRFPEAQVLMQWETLRNLVPETGYWPIIGWDRFKKPPWDDALVQDAQDIIDEGLCIDIQSWFEQEILHTNVNEIGVGILPTQTPSPFIFRLHHRGSPYTILPGVPIALLPTSHGWEVPAYLSVTSNEWDSSRAAHVAILKYWHERWDAELVSMVAGSMELRVLRPPTTWKEAVGLAKEQYLYCPDIVDQMVGNIDILAKILLNGHVWRFWWD